LVMFCFFKWATYRYPFWPILPYENSTWLRPFFCSVCIPALLSKIFFPEIFNFYIKIQAYAKKEFLAQWAVVLFQVIFILSVVLLLYIPKPEEVTALSLAWDQWNHLDTVTGWFIQHGWCISYEETIQLLITGAILYIIGLFYFIRYWLHSWLLAAAGALLTIKMGMFYYGAAPCIWINPANSFLAHGWDIFLLGGLGIVSVKDPKKFYPMAGLLGVMLILGWFKFNGNIEFLGLDNQSLIAPLRTRQFFPFFMGYLVPIFYVFSLLVLMGQAVNQKKTPLQLPIVICIYGLMIFISYLEHPMTGFYGSLMLPAILVGLWWVNQGLSHVTLLVKRQVGAGILLLVLGALLTNRMMLIYPNTFFQDDGRFVQETNIYQHFDAIKDSAPLIRQLTKEDEKIALLSNFDTALLMQANRQSLFDDTPLMFSSLNGQPGGLRLIRKTQCLKLINTIEDNNPLYIFVDERLLALSPQVLGNSGLKVVLDYIQHHYGNYAHQGFLVAFRRQ